MSTPYTPTTWEDEIPDSTPVKYSITDDILGAIATSATIEVETDITPGTAVNATKLNKLEQGVYQNSLDIAQNESDISDANDEIDTLWPNTATAAGQISLSNGAGSDTVLDAASNAGKIIRSDGSTWTIVDDKVTLNISFGNGINAVQAAADMGGYVWVRVPKNCTILDWEISGDASGSCVIEVWKSANLAGLTSMTGSNSIAGSEKPTLSSQQVNSNTSLSTWTPDLSEGNYLAFFISGTPATVKKVLLALKLKAR